jgi:hypothetical protein
MRGVRCGCRERVWWGVEEEHGAGPWAPQRPGCVGRGAERDAAEQERERIRRELSRKGRQPTARTLASASFTFLLCTLPASEAPPTLLADLYRAPPDFSSWGYPLDDAPEPVAMVPLGR